MGKSPAHGGWVILQHQATMITVLLCLIMTGNGVDIEKKKKMKTYIVHMDNSAMPTSIFTSHADWYSSKIQSVITTSQQQQQQHVEEEEGVVGVTDDYYEAKKRILYTYHHSFHGTAVQLTEKEVSLLKKEDGVLTIYPETIYQLHTTRSPLFLGLLGKTTTTTTTDDDDDDDDDHSMSSNVVVGILDTGIWPESPSFNDSNIHTPPPQHWHGKCESGHKFTPTKHCNRKIIGARMFYHGYESSTGTTTNDQKSPRDNDGHGTHTAATVAGSIVHNANLLGYASGTARGMAVQARVAVYKVCWSVGCFSSDILSAIDTAVSDGVDVLSISLGGGVSSTYYKDPLSVATFGAMEKGVIISCSAGNGGPELRSLTNVAPWVMTVGASTMDRDFPAIITLGNGKRITGSSIYRGRFNLSGNRLYPLVYPGGNGSTTSSSSPDPSSLCLEGTLNPNVVRGKIVICDRGINPRVEKGEVVKRAGGIGMILANTAENGEELVADCHLIPAIAVGEKEGEYIKRYTLSTTATATLRFIGTRIGVHPSPVVAAFSSRGPNILSPSIMKPDVIAPGVNILAAWTGAMSPSGLETDPRRVRFNVISGTSMSAPHVSGVLALIRGRHRDWSPSAVKSALMTTSYVNGRGGGRRNFILDAANGQPSSPFQHGSGHIDPVKAMDPGLVYDIDVQDYYDFLCTQKMSPTELRVFAKSSNRTCSNIRKHYHQSPPPGDLNYPAISFVFESNANTTIRSMTVRRTVTNVGPPISNYRVAVSSSRFKTVSVVVEPRRLNFTRKGERLGFTVKLNLLQKRGLIMDHDPEFGYLVWKDGVHRVRSPILVTTHVPVS